MDQQLRQRIVDGRYSRIVASDELTDAIVRLETAVWHALVAGDRAADEALLSDDFVGVYTTGFATRDDHVGELADGPSMFDFALDSIDVAELADGVARITYAADYRSRADAPQERMYITSLWELRDGHWINTFSQDTPAETA